MTSNNSNQQNIQSERTDYGVKRYPVAPEDFTIAKVRAGIPREMFKQDTIKSFGYMFRDLAQVAVFHYIMSSFVAPMLESSSSFIPEGILGFILSFAVWNLFWFFQGLNFTALWVLAHEAGHGGFSNSKTINELVGFVLHTALLVPYHSWRVTHATHHKYTNHLTQDTVFVPKRLPEPLKEAIAEAPVISTLQFVGMLTAGWPAYLGFNVASQEYEGKRANHFEPSSPLFKKSDKWGVVVSDIGLLVVFAVIAIAIKQTGFWTVFAYYGVPYLWTNAWLVYITFMQHHDLRIPYYTEEHFNFVRGALCSVDRDYGFCNAWLHHINDSHVVHHLFSDMPFYNAIQVTRNHIKPILGDLYASDKRNIVTQTMECWRKCLYVVPSEGITYFRH